MSSATSWQPGDGIAALADDMLARADEICERAAEACRALPGPWEVVRTASGFRDPSVSTGRIGEVVATFPGWDEADAYADDAMWADRDANPGARPDLTVWPYTVRQVGEA